MLDAWKRAGGRFIVAAALGAAVLASPVTARATETLRFTELGGDQLFVGPGTPPGISSGIFTVPDDEFLSVTEGVGQTECGIADLGSQLFLSCASGQSSSGDFTALPVAGQLELEPPVPANPVSGLTVTAFGLGGFEVTTTGASSNSWLIEKGTELVPAAVPEPSSIAILAVAGALGFAASRRRRGDPPADRRPVGMASA